MTDSEAVLMLTKLAPTLIYPLGLVITLFIFGLVMLLFDKRRPAFSALSGAAVWLWVASTPAFGDWAIATLERQYPAKPIETMAVTDVAIVLGGTLGQPAPPRIEIDLHGSVDRVFQALRLYKEGRVKHLLVTGGNLPWQPDVTPEAELIRSFLIDWGHVPPDAVEIATESRNTYENALEIKRLWDQRRFNSAYLLTSAAHMPRAMAVFKKAGLPVVAATTDIDALQDVPWTPLRWLPDVAALERTTVAIKEWVGYLAYRTRGYI